MTSPRIPPAVLTRLATVALWALVAGACATSVAGYMRLPDPAALAPEAPPPLPTQAAGFAELAVATHLRGAALDGSITEAPPGPPDLQVEDTVTALARSPEPGRWWVVVAATVRDLVDGIPSGPARVEHYGVQVAELAHGLAAVTRPALVAAPAPATDASSRIGAARPVRPGDPVSSTVTGFLTALLTPADDLERWVAPQADLAAVRPAPFTEIALTGLASAPDRDGQDVLAEVAGTRPTGAVQPLQYPLRLAVRDGRWEVVQLLESLPIHAGGVR